MDKTVSRVALPLGFVGCVAWAAYGLAGWLPHISALMIALFGGVALGRWERFRTWVEPGARFAGKQLLRVGVAILGLRLSFTDFMELGYETLIVIVAVICGTMWLGRCLSARMGLSPQFGTLISAGTAICGASAVATVAPIVEAEEGEVSFSVTLVTLFGLIGVIVYPPLGRALGMTDTTFGIWAGVAIHDTAQVMAASFSFSPLSGEVAAAAKMLRISGLLPVTLMLMAAQARRKPTVNKTVSIRERLRAARQAVPNFLVAFVFFVILRSSGVIPDTIAGLGLKVSEVLLVVAMAGIGMTTRLGTFRDLGWRAIVVSFVTATVAGLVGYIGIVLFGIA